MYYIELTNNGSEDCATRGTPAVTMVDTNGSSVGSMTKSDSYNRAGEPVTTAPGGHAYVWMHLANSPQSCASSVEIPTLTVTIPDATNAITLDKALRVCIDDPGQSTVQVGPTDSEPRAASKGY